MTVYVFEGLELDARRRILSRADGEPIPLAPKVFDTLLYFVERPGQLLGKRELIEAIWPNVVVEENNLNQYISALRRQLGETPGQHRFIVTEPGRGYRFVAAVRTAMQTEGSRAADQASAAGEASLATRTLPWIAVSVLAGLVGGVAAWNMKPSEAPVRADAPRNVMRLGIDLGDGLRLSGGVAMEANELVGLQRPSRPSFSLSPDGTQLVYAATDGDSTRLYLRRLDVERPTLIQGTEGASQPFFSPDNLSVGFLVGSDIKTVPIEGGEVRTVVTLGPNPKGRIFASWTEDDTILFSADGGIFEVPATGGNNVQLTRVDVDRSVTVLSHGYPQMLPGRRAVLYNVNPGHGTPSDWAIVADTLDGAETRTLIEGGSQPTYLSSGHIAFARTGALWAVPFDVTSLEVTGAPVVVVEDIMHGEGGLNNLLNVGAAQISISSTGLLAYAPGGIYPERTNSLVWVDRSGEVEPLPLPPASYSGPRFSPDGGRLAYGIGYSGHRQLWVYDIGLETPRALTNSGSHSGGPVWSPHGDSLAFSRSMTGLPQLLRTSAAGGRQSQPIGEALVGWPSSWSTRNMLAFVGPTYGTWTVSLDDASGPARFVEKATFPEFSPDGHWLAYAAFEGGQHDVYLRPFPEGAPVHRISSDGGWAPLWSRDGQELYYFKAGAETNEHRVMVVNVQMEPTFSRSQPRVLFEGDFASTVPLRSYDVSPDGRRFVFATNLTAIDPQPVTRINFALNWFQELNERVPVP